MKIQQSIRGFALAAAALAALPVTSRAAMIAWGTATTISADSNVVNGGMNAALTVGAFRLGLPGLTAATCNGVTFQPFTFAENTNAAVTVGNFTINPGFSTSTNTRAGTTSGGYGQLPAATQNLLQSSTLSQNNGLTLTMNGLVIGQVYTFEFWNNNAGNFTTYGYQIDRTYSGTAATGTYVQTVANTSGATSTLGGVGQFAVGTFTADATSQSVFFKSTNDYALLNAFQLRTGNAVVPEPGTWAMMGVGVGLLGFVTLRRRAGRA